MSSMHFLDDRTIDTSERLNEEDHGKAIANFSLVIYMSEKRRETFVRSLMVVL